MPARTACGVHREAASQGLTQIRVEPVTLTLEVTRQYGRAMRKLAGIALLTVLVMSQAVASAAASADSSQLVAAARAFLETLTPEQRARALFAFAAEERFVWHYTPVSRRGLPLKDMTEPQRQAAMNLLRAGLSEPGYAKAETIRSLEDVLVEMGGSPRYRDRDLYYFSVFGTPDATATWGWRYEGHHLSQHWTVVNGTALVTTPQFFGANPAEVRQGKLRGTRALAVEEDLAYGLLSSLDDTQRASAIIDRNAPNDILTSNSRQAAIQADLGLAYARLLPRQQVMLLDLIETHARATVPSVAAERLAKLRAAGLEGIKFAWMGSTERSQGHYYRIQGSTFLIELDNTQDDANHVHAVWRDFNGDFGRDLLGEHYRAAPHR